MPSIVESAKRIMAPFIMLVGVIGVFGSVIILVICLHKCATMNKNRPQTQEQMELQQRELTEQLYNLNII